MRFARPPAVASAGRLPIAGEGCDGPVSLDHPHAVGGRIGDIDVPSRVDGQAGGVAELSRDGQPPITTGARLPRPGDRLDDPAAVDSSDAEVGRVGEVQIAGAVQQQRLRRRHAGLHGRAAISRESRLAGPGQRGNNTGR